MPEILLHYIWWRGLFLSTPQFTTDGRSIDVISIGQHNRDAGPDFTNVHLRIDGQDWIGNVEIHVSSSDWYKHHHDTDRAYDNIILHVVRHADKEVRNSLGDNILQCELQYPMNEDYIARWLREAPTMDNASQMLDCARQLTRDPALLTMGWRQALLINRLQCKQDSIRRLLDILKNDWDQAFYITLAHNFGFHTNGVPFEQLALATPLHHLRKYRNSLLQMTAILLGQSGLLDSLTDEDAPLLRREYAHFRHALNLTPIDGHMWKSARMRPQNFPQTRIRQFATLLHQSEFLFSRAMDARDTDALMALFSVPGMGADSVRLLIINTVIPYLFARGKHEQAVQLLQQLPAENNTIIRQWRTLGQTVQNAADTQALIHLYLTYCTPHRCLNCDVAWEIFRLHP